MRVHVTVRGFALRTFVLSLVLAVACGALPASAAVPNRPIDLGMEGWGPTAADGLPCATGVDRPVVPTRTPRLRARVFSETGSAAVSGFRVYTGTADDHTWNDEDFPVDFVPSGSFAETTVPDGRLADGGVYTWQAWQGSAAEPGGFSALCEFEVDATAPNTPTVSSSDYPADVVSGGVGEPGGFTFGPSGSPDVVRYGWSLGVDSGDVTAVDGTATVTITPTKWGTNVLYVTAFDRAGTRSATRAVHQFVVPSPTPPTGYWKLDETGGTTAADSSGSGRPLTLAGGATLGSGYSGNALALDGTAAFAATEAPVVDPTRAFSVSAWVKLDDASSSRTVVSQDGSTDSAFALRYDADLNRWTVATARSAAAPEIGVWTHLVGVHVPTTHQFLLYVNGKLEGTSASGALGAATGPLVVGAGQVAGNRAEHFAGSIDLVQTWGRVVTAAEVSTVANRPGLRAHYPFSETTGTTTRDLVSGAEGVLSGGVAFTGGRRGRWTTFDASSTGRVTAPLPAGFRTDRSYSVAAWVRAGAFDGADRTAVSTTGSLFSLGYSAGYWAFSVPKSDGTDVRSTSFSAAEADQWTHLVGVHDAVTGRTTLFVDGVEQTTATTPVDAGTASTGGLLVGGGPASGAWSGEVDDVMVHAGVLDDSDVFRVYNDTYHR
jgi:concanavalin A-like lectin/glucanase superfamily protein